MLHPENDQGNGDKNSSERLALFHDSEVYAPFIRYPQRSAVYRT
jgi:hypothetical protein